MEKRVSRERKSTKWSYAEIPISRCCYREMGSCGKVCFVFSCPGQEEFINNCPAFGKTGDGLALLLTEIQNQWGDTSNCLHDAFETTDFQRGKIHINNAWPKALWKSKHRRSQALDSWIKQKKNLERLKRELNGCKLIICFGKKAKFAISQVVCDNSVVLYHPHLGQRGLLSTGMTKEIAIRKIAQLILSRSSCPPTKTP